MTTFLVIAGIAVLIVLWGMFDAKQKGKAQRRFQLAQHARIVEESAHFVEHSPNIKTRISRCGVMIDHLRQMQELAPDDQEIKRMLVDAEKDLEQLHIEQVEADANRHLKKVEAAKTAATKQKYITQAMQVVRDAKKEGILGTNASASLSRLNELYHQVAVDEFVEKGKRAEFKKQAKKAVEFYMDALYNLLNDDIDDGKQKDQIDWLRQKITALDPDQAQKLTAIGKPAG